MKKFILIFALLAIVVIIQNNSPTQSTLKATQEAITQASSTIQKTQDITINKTENKLIKGKIYSSLSSSMKNAGVPSNIINNFTNIFLYKVNFRSDIKTGDSFKVLYERKIAPDGRIINGDILYGELQLGKKKKVALYRYKDISGNINYYDEQGIALKRTLDYKPLEFREAPISSTFTPEIQGIVYEAPIGSRVYASGDGVITAINDDYIIIRHNSEYSTGYGRLKSYAKGIRSNLHVKAGQIIAYVGDKGVYFEIIKNGKKIDPLKVKTVIGEDLTGEKLKNFKEKIANTNMLVDEDYKNAEILRKLQKKLPYKTRQSIEEIKVYFYYNKVGIKRCSAIIYIKNSHAHQYKSIAYQTVQELLNILIADGYKPFNEQILVSAMVFQKIKGVTGQIIPSFLGSASYDYTNDSIR